MGFLLGRSMHLAYLLDAVGLLLNGRQPVHVVHRLQVIHIRDFLYFCH